MDVLVVRGYDELSREASRLVLELVHRKPDLCLALPSGGTPVGMYQNLVRAAAEGTVDFSGIRLFDIDTYAGIPEDSPHTNRSYLMHHFVSRVSLKESQWVPMNSETVDWPAYAEEYETRIRLSGGLDLMVDGLGHNGHLGYNEPGSSFYSRTRLVEIAKRTRLANARFFPSLENVPRYGFTLGIGTILEASQIVILASGTGKSEIVRRVVEGPITEEVPMTAIRRHRNAILIIDEDAAGRLTTGKQNNNSEGTHG